MSNGAITGMTRQQLYDEIWTLSVAGVAKKHGADYSFLYAFCKENNIPVPPKGYWTKKEHNKPVTPIPLPLLDSDTAPLHILGVKSSEKTEPTNFEEDKKELADLVSSDLMSITTDSTTQVEEFEPKTITYYGQILNVYDRETLYQEVWAKPVTEVAKKYGVSDVAIHKVCKALDVPTPPNGYWAKVYAGKPVIKIPLPKSGKPAQKNGLRTASISAPSAKGEKKPLAFLSEEDRMVVLAVARQIYLPADGATMHTKIVAHKRHLADQQKKANEVTRRSYGRHDSTAQVSLFSAISKESEQRAYRIMDALFRAIEPLGCSITDELKLIIRSETVSFSMHEMQDQAEHVLTKEETLALLKYEDEKKRSTWAYKPNIRKYDRPYNGRLSITVTNGRSFRDGKNDILEDRLGDVLIELYEASELVRLDRLAREEAERKRQEEQMLRDERRKRYNEEVERTIALENEAKDYEIACRIRRYVSAIESNGIIDEKTAQWISWANDKADWYDPTIAKDDDFFGVRPHKKGSDTKTLKPSYW